MPRKSVKQTGIEIILIIVGGIMIAFIALWNFLVETKLIWAVPAIIAIGVALRWYSKRRAEEKRALEDEKRAFLGRQAEEKRALLRKQAEEKRIENILAHRSEWSEEMCQWLIGIGADINDARVAGIMQQIDEWGIEMCQNLIQRRIGLGMTDKMVRLSLGEPTNVDNREINDKTEKFRWIYGIPRKGAAYIWFKDGVVTKIKH